MFEPSPAVVELRRAIECERNENGVVVNLRRIVLTRTTLQPKYAYDLVRSRQHDLGITRVENTRSYGRQLQIYIDHNYQQIPLWEDRRPE